MTCHILADIGPAQIQIHHYPYNRLIGLVLFADNNAGFTLYLGTAVITYLHRLKKKAPKIFDHYFFNVGKTRFMVTTNYLLFGWVVSTSLYAIHLGPLMFHIPKKRQ